MESRSKKARSHRAAPSSRVPDDILRFNILPRLSFKSLARFKSVSKSWHALISDDSLFAADQSRHSSPTSSGLVYLGSSGSLEFLSGPDTPIGVPQPSFCVPFHCCRSKLLASTNGLLCCRFGVPDFNDDYSPCLNLLYVFNPATKEAHLVSKTQYQHLFVGLAFDPSNSPGRYTLVFLCRCLDIIEGYLKTQFRFHVFSSDIRKLLPSNQRVLVDGLLSCDEPTAVFAGGVLYWDCLHYLIWFDPSKNLAGRTPLPEKPSSASQHQIGVWEGRVLTCTQTSGEKVEVFVMENACSTGNWVRRHVSSFETMVRGNLEVFARFFHPMRLRNMQSLWGRLASRWLVRPLALDGGDKLYLGVRPKRRNSKEKERVLCYDLRTGEITSISDGVRLVSSEDRVFSYHNSMVRMPILGRRR